jgi:hypothetical protein
LQIYTAGYKSLPLHDDTFALLRKATRLDLFLKEPNSKAVGTKTCTECGVDVSPLWHEVVDDEDAMEVDGVPSKLAGKKRVCHLCWFKYR